MNKYSIVCGWVIYKTVGLLNHTQFNMYWILSTGDFVWSEKWKYTAADHPRHSLYAYRRLVLQFTSVETRRRRCGVANAISADPVRQPLTVKSRGRVIGELTDAARDRRYCKCRNFLSSFNVFCSHCYWKAALTFCNSVLGVFHPPAYYLYTADNTMLLPLCYSP